MTVSGDSAVIDLGYVGHYLKLWDFPSSQHHECLTTPRFYTDLQTLLNPISDKVLHYLFRLACRESYKRNWNLRQEINLKTFWVAWHLNKFPFLPQLSLSCPGHSYHSMIIIVFIMFLLLLFLCVQLVHLSAVVLYNWSFSRGNVVFGRPLCFMFCHCYGSLLFTIWWLGTSLMICSYTTRNFISQWVGW